MTKQLVYPMVFYVVYIWLLAGFNFRTRLRAIKCGSMSPDYFKGFKGDPPTERVNIVGRHYDNQFQLPLLFLIACCAHLALQHADQFTIVVAWAFVISRLLHSFIHLGRNQLKKRVLAFACGWLLNLLLWLQLLYLNI